MSDATEWHALLDGIHDALAHGLNGRLAGISGITQVARMRGEVDAELLGLLDDELARLGNLAAVAANLPRSRGRGRELTAIADTIADLEALARLQERPLQIEQPAACPAVRMARDNLTRCLLLAIAGVTFDRVGAEATISLQIEEVAPQLRVRLTRTVAEARGGSQVVSLADELNTRALAEAQRILADAGGDVAVAGSAAVELRLPAAY